MKKNDSNKINNKNKSELPKIDQFGEYAESKHCLRGQNWGQANFEARPGHGARLGQVL